MKKLILLASAALVGFNANAQQAELLSVSGANVKKAVLPKAAAGNYQPSAKSTIAGSRWYNHGFVVNSDILPGQTDLGFFPIWFDASVKQRFSDGNGGTLLDTINFSSVAQVVDPIHFVLYNDVNVPSNSPNDIAIPMNQDYKIDSVSFNAFYVEVLNRPLTIVDTLIISVSASGDGSETPFQERFPSSPNFTNNGYVDINTADTIIKGFRVDPVDSVNRASAVSGVAMWKVPIDSSMRRPDSAGFIFRSEFTLPVIVNGTPGNVVIPAGKTAGVTITFKSGDVVNAGDSFNHYNHMYITTGEAAGDGQPMPYYHYQYRDQNMSNLMFSTDPTYYGASVVIEGRNSIDFSYEFHDISAHIVCDNCPTVAEFSSVHNVNSSVGTDMLAFPNPANSEINVSFYMNQNTAATVSISNAVGQVIATQEVADVVAKKENKVTFSTANLAPGIYFYTVEAKGQRTTNRFVVAH